MTGRIGVVYDIDTDTAFYAQYGTGATHPGSSVVTASALTGEAKIAFTNMGATTLRASSTSVPQSWSTKGFSVASAASPDGSQ